MTLHFAGGIDDEIFVERSTDLRGWSTLGSVVLDQGEGSYALSSTNTAAGFLRLRRNFP